MGAIGSAQGWVLLVLGVAALAMEVYALVDAVTHRTDAFPAAGKRTKPFWLVILVIAVAIGFITIFNVIGGFIGLLAVVAAGVYLADVRPALRQVTGKGGQRQGPYGPW
ncbi:MAG: DUF2516 family protein [Nostocoides sp.]